MSSPDKNPPPPASTAAISEVRYSLPQLLREVQEERRAPAFAMEKLDQVEIAKLFTRNKRPRRAKS
ncbi:MAG: hypothetical protein JWQ83_2060 [Lacunisphaera sp.]|nr:hypothetical protein [Lacunisphaera sp.]MDB6166920.1 hypothetical protein [Lacunisphaera sp.]